MVVVNIIVVLAAPIVGGAVTVDGAAMIVFLLGVAPVTYLSVAM